MTKSVVASGREEGRYFGGSPAYLLSNGVAKLQIVINTPEPELERLSSWPKAPVETKT